VLAHRGDHQVGLLLGQRASGDGLVEPFDARRDEGICHVGQLHALRLGNLGDGLARVHCRNQVFDGHPQRIRQEGGQRAAIAHHPAIPGALRPLVAVGARPVEGTRALWGLRGGGVSCAATIPAIPITSTNTKTIVIPNFLAISASLFEVVFILAGSYEEVVKKGWGFDGRLACPGW
jgi:hypothetical protein